MAIVTCCTAHTLQCVAVCGSALQCVAVRCSVLQCHALWCSVLQCVAVRCSALQCVAARNIVLQCAAVSCSVLQCVVVCCSVSQRVAVCCSWYFLDLQSTENNSHRHIDRKNPPPPGGCFLFTMFPDQGRGPPSKNLYQVLRGDSSPSGFLIRVVNRKLPRGGGFRSINILSNVGGGGNAIATYCNTLQHTATHCNILQQPA